MDTKIDVIDQDMTARALARRARESFNEMHPTQWQPVLKVGHATFFGPSYESRAEAERVAQCAKALGLTSFVARKDCSAIDERGEG